MTKLIAPSHICGPMLGAVSRRLFDERTDFIKAAAKAGCSKEDIASALGVGARTIDGTYKAGLAEMKHPPAPHEPAPDRVAITVRSDGRYQAVRDNVTVSLPPSPWGDDLAGHDPRHETAPRRRGLVGGHVVRGDLAEDIGGLV